MTSAHAALPATPIEPVTESIGGITFEDPYAWLEPDDERALAWQAAQDAVARDRLHSWEGEDALRMQVQHYIADAFTAAPQRFGAHWFSMRLGSTDVELTVSDSPVGTARVLVDTGVLGEERGPASLDWFYPSPDGRLVAYGLSFGGDEQSVLHLVETESGHVLDDRIPFMSAGIVSWLPDSSGFWYNAGLAPDFENADKHIFCHRVGQTTPSKPEKLKVREAYCVHPQVSPDGRWVAAITSEMDVRPDFVKRLPDGQWTPFLRGLGHYAYGTFVGDSYIAVTNHDAPRGRLVQIPLDGGGNPSTWTELLPESEIVMRNVARAGDHLIVTFYRDAYSELRVLRLDGTFVSDVELPGPGVSLQLSALGGHYQAATPNLGGFTVQPGPDSFTFVFSGPTRSLATYLYDIPSRSLEELVAPREIRDDLAVRECYASAPDGAAVPYTVIHRADLDTSIPQPTVLYGYGGWNIAFVPSAAGVFSPLIDAGVVFVFMHLRGGGEGGEAMWHGGRLADKQRTFDDLYAIAEQLIEAGATTSEQLGVVGLSNGGLLTGVAVTQRPDLFRVVTSMVPLYDMLKFDRDPYTASCTLEYGEPHIPEQAYWMYRYSPYHNVRDTTYPATLIVCGSNDMRCRPWQARKLAARIQAANTGQHPVLLRVLPDGGHLSVLGAVENVVEWLGFLMRELGVKPSA